MLRPRRRTYAVATASVFAALYAVLGLIPISRLVGIGAFITFREMVSPLAGMILGPVTGGLSIVLGVFIDFGLGRPPTFLGLDFLIDLAAAVTAGLAFTGRRKLALLFPSAVLAVLLLGPSSPLLVSFGGIPFVWMHVVSLVSLGLALYLEQGGRIRRPSVWFVGATMFASTMCGHAMGGILTEYVYLSSGVLFGYANAGGYWTAIFFLYPAERLFLTIVGTAVALPVLRALSRRQRAPTASE